MRVFQGIEELAEAVGSHVGYSEWRVLDQSSIDEFAAATGDHQWIHVDVERARSGPYGGTIAHGFLTLALTSALTWEVMRVDDLEMELNYGCNKVRFPSPVMSGSFVRVGVEIVSLDPYGDGFMLTTKVSVEVQGAAKPACVAECLGYLVPLSASVE